MIRQRWIHFTLLRTAVRATIALMLIGLPFIPSVANADPVQFFQSFAGNVNFQMTGASRRQSPNSIDACAVLANRTDASAQLVNIPNGAIIRAAYLYWAGSGSSPDNRVRFQGQRIDASRTFTERFTNGSTNYDFFSGFADVTHLVNGNGTYRLRGLAVDNGNPYCSVQAVLSGWSIIVIYEHTSEPLRVINLYHGFRYFRASEIILTPDNFRIPQEGCGTIGDCKWGVLTWEGDAENSGSISGFTENLFVNGNQMTTSVNPPNNQFNSTIDLLGVSPSPPGSQTYGIDIDMYSPLPLSPGDTQAETIYRSGQDLVLLSAQVFSVRNTEVADLSIAKSHTGDFLVGQNGDYTLQVTNNGPNDTTTPDPITVSDPLPAGLSFVSHTGTNWSCSAAGQTVNCQHPGPIPSGGTLPDLTLTVGAGAAAVPSVTNTATVSHTTFDNRSDNNSSDDNTAVVQPALSITKTVATYSHPVPAHTNPKAIPGAIMEYTITVTNTSSSDIDRDSVVITDTLPPHLRLVLTSPNATTAVSPVEFDPGTSNLTLDPTDVGDPTSGQNDVALSRDGGSNFLNTIPASEIVDGIDAGTNRIDFIRLNPKSILRGGTGASFSVKFWVQVQ